MTKETNILLLMTQAGATKHGVEINCNDAELFQRRFHAERNKQRATGNIAFDTLRCRIVSKTIVYLINDEGTDGESTGQGAG